MDKMNIMKQTIYLVDSENVNDAWVQLLPKLDRWDRIIVFHTKNSPHFTTESASQMADFQSRLTWEKCFTGTNGLDFQLVTRLGYLICKKPRATFVIVSNDTGFDAAIKYWVQEGKQVSRIRGASCKEEAPLTEVQEKIILEDAPDKQQRRPRKRKKKSGNGGQGQNGKEADKNQPESRKEADKSQSESHKEKDKTQQKGRKEPDKTQPEGHKEPDKNRSEGREEAGRLRSESRKEPDKGQPENRKDPDRSHPGSREEAGKDPAGNQKDQDKQGNKGGQNKKKQDKDIPVSSVLGICRSISMNRHEMVHEALVALLGAEDGRQVYYFLKDNQEFQSQLCKIYLPDRNQRVENYLQVVFGYHKEEVEDMEQIRGLINKFTAHDRNGLFQALTESFGHKKGARYYGILKPHVRVLKKL